jgi:hypothetical protein
MANHSPDCVCEKCLKRYERIFADSEVNKRKSVGRLLGEYLGAALWHLRYGFPRLWSRKQRVAPAELARSLYEVFVEEQCDDEGLTQFEIPEADVPGFRAKVTLYREAVILMVLRSESRRQNQYREVLSAYEELVLGPERTPAGLKKLDALKAAMADLERLIHPQDASMDPTWSSEWLKDIGHVDYNPARTLLFAMSWTTQYSTIVESIRAFELRA